MKLVQVGTPQVVPENIYVSESALEIRVTELTAASPRNMMGGGGSDII